MIVLENPQGPNESEYVVVNPAPETFKGRTIDLADPPLVSFCIPTLNNERTLGRCLHSIANQDYPHQEIIIVDGHSRDNTIRIAEQFTDEIYYDKGTLGSARQTSIDHARGDVLALFDSDIIIPHRSWLSSAIRYFNYSDRVSTVWPANDPPPGKCLISRLYFNHWRMVMEDRMRKKRGLFGGGNSLLLRRCMDEIGGVNRLLHWGEDFDWAGRLKRKGYQVVFIRDALIHDTMRTLNEFSRKQSIGARTFTATGFQLMNLSTWNVFYEQVVIGMKGMIVGILIDTDPSWFLYPILLSLKGGAYANAYVADSARKEGMI